MDHISLSHHAFLEQGQQKIRWAEMHLHLLKRLQEEFQATTPFAGLTIGICLHIEPKTAVLCALLQTGGAQVVITGSPGTTQNDVAAALQSTGVRVLGQREDGIAVHGEHIQQVLQHRPHLLLDNGADLVAAWLKETDRSAVLAGTEETTTGANRLREDLGGAVPFPIIVINDSPLKLIMENEHGVGPTVVEAFMQITNLLVAGKCFTVFGYGSVGRGIARSLHALGGRVTVVEPDSVRALEAVLNGMHVAGVEEALHTGEVFFTATGRPGIITQKQIDGLPDGAILANAGHFSWEIDRTALRSQARRIERLSQWIEVFTLEDGRHITLLTGGEMVNLAGGGGNPVETMDLGLALQAQSLRYLVEQHEKLPAGPQPVPASINRQVAQQMVEALTRRERD